MKFSFLLILLILSGCTSWKYAKDGDGVSFGVRSWNHDPISVSIPTADAATFRQVGDGYAIDRVSAYYKGRIIEYADPDTFRVLGSGYSYDQFHVYRGTCRLEESDPLTFQILDGGWSKDNRNVFHGHSLISEADVSSFRFLGDCWAIDNERAFQALSMVSTSCGSGSLLGVAIFDGIDPYSFVVIDCFNARDGSRNYEAN
tara:strand:+ start:52 stop:654 length:603 start_codon:yes stop_codon:yes gene_type:complete